MKSRQSEVSAAEIVASLRRLAVPEKALPPPGAGWFTVAALERDGQSGWMVRQWLRAARAKGKVERQSFYDETAGKRIPHYREKK